MKEKLLCHLLFVEKMLLKVKGTINEDKWKNLHNIITSPQIEISDNDVLKIDTTIRETIRNMKQQTLLHQTQPKTESTTEPKVENAINSISTNESITQNRPSSSVQNSPDKTIRNNLQATVAVKPPTKHKKKRKKKSNDRKSGLKVDQNSEKPEIHQPKIPILKLKLSDIFNESQHRRLLKEKKKSQRIIKDRHSLLRKSVQFEQVSTTETQKLLHRQEENNDQSLKLMNGISSTNDQSISKAHKIKPTPDNMKLQSENCLRNCDDIVEKTIIPEEEIKMEVDPVSSDEPPIPIMISHMSFTIQRNEITYHCNVCNEKYPSNCLFLKHLKAKHRSIRWSGDCIACQKTLSSEKWNVYHELDHMYKNHVLKVHTPSPMVCIPSDLLPNSQPLHQEHSSYVLLDPASTLKKLRPYISSSESKHQKFEEPCEAMLKIECLAALYKCMSIDCSFFTSDKSLFTKHLLLHQKYQSSDIVNFSSCAYCEFQQDGSLADLSTHIETVHGSSKYQCTHCFYRSFDLQVKTHQRLHHAMKTKSFIECEAIFEKNPALVFAKVKENGPLMVPGMTCMICKVKIYDFPRFKEHLSTHDNLPKSKCLKCKGLITPDHFIAHLKLCHGFGNMQCCYCRFGTDQLETFIAHLSNCHPTEIPIFFDRVHQTTRNKRSTMTEKFLPLKRLNMTRSNRYKVLKAPNEKVLRNQKSVNMLSKNCLV